ncbi:MAG: hypothetical protein JJU34_07715 [Lunatimonas sp.]|uniref:helix-turn-helix domain containing protein n=1 Tax=Lunatimonas sp. TaxID=2060141 RepID=UPI00263B7A2D|nr:helix-turn-helix domain containing protein [Lunatimonas sp.]MCC5937153.1 hypothetical protein [Lunatimonas sp.]
MTQRAKSRLEIADEYGISAKTLTRWLKKNNIQLSNGLVTLKEQAQIYEAFGYPENKIITSDSEANLDSDENPENE